MGEGIIRISKGIFKEIPTAEPTTLDEWHGFLLLPGNYRVVDLTPVQDLYEVSVVSDAIRNDVAVLPEVTPTYRKDNSKVTLESIDIRYIEEVT